MTRRPALHLLPWVLVVALIGLNVLRIAEHQMWRDEIQAWRLAVETPSLTELYHLMGWEAHPILWYLLLWLLGKVTSDPLAMKLLHAAIGAAIYLLVVWKAPLSWLEKILILLSYFFLFEYWIISRNYSLGILLALLFLWLRGAAPERIILAFFLLGVMANTNVYAAILAIAMAAVTIFEERRNPRLLLAGSVLFGALLLFAIITLSQDHPLVRGTVVRALVDEDSWRPLRVATWILPQVFVPVHHGFPVDFWPPYMPPLVRIALIVPLAILLFLALRRDRHALLMFGLLLVGVYAFTYLFYSGGVRHWGILYVGFVCALWMLRTRVRDFSLPVVILLGINAAAGLGAAAAERLGPFSQAAPVARWIEANGHGDAVWAGFPAPTSAAVAGLLGKPFHYPTCTCSDTFIRWDQHPREFPPEDVPAWLATLMQRLEVESTFLLLDPALAPVVEANAGQAGLMLTPLARFEGAEVDDENYIIFRVEDGS